MHKLLQRQLKKTGLGDLSDIKDERWLNFIERVDAAYHQADEERYTNERANDISSKEMLTLYKKLEASSASALAIERDRLKLVLKSIGYGLLLLDDNGVVLDTNSACEKLLGWQDDELIGAKISSFIFESSPILDLTTVQNVAECLFNRKNQPPIDVSFVLSPIFLGSESQGAVLIFRDISEQLLDRKILIEARIAAEKASRAKSEFLSRMSHELRTPMNVILGFAQLLELHCTGEDSNQVVAIEQIQFAGNHLLDLINDVLDLAKIEAGKMEVSFEEISITKVVNDCLSLICIEADQKQIQLINKVGNYTGLALVDELRLKQICLNLLSNALKYNHIGGHVIVSTQLIEQRMIRVSFTDNGPGLSEFQINQLFNQFERLENTDSVEGTGIGLVITKHLTELMEGTIEVVSKPGQGSTFMVTFKLLTAQ